MPDEQEKEECFLVEEDLADEAQEEDLADDDSVDDEEVLADDEQEISN